MIHKVNHCTRLPEVDLHQTLLGKTNPLDLTHLGKLISLHLTYPRTAECCQRDCSAWSFSHETHGPNLSGAVNAAHPSLYAFLIDLLLSYSLFLILLQSLLFFGFRWRFHNILLSGNRNSHDLPHILCTKSTSLLCLCICILFVSVIIKMHDASVPIRSQLLSACSMEPILILQDFTSVISHHLSVH